MMRVQISITDDEGRVFEGEAELSLLGHGSGKPVSGRERSRKSHETKSGSLQTPVFSLNPRAFMKRYARGRSGPQKFTLLLACLAKGDSSTTESLGLSTTMAAADFVFWHRAGRRLTRSSGKHALDYCASAAIHIGSYLGPTEQLVGLLESNGLRAREEKLWQGRMGS